jgi:hypothetical protein
VFLEYTCAVRGLLFSGPVQVHELASLVVAGIQKFCVITSAVVIAC